ncbi:hypothetical protein [Halomarina rubra]|uniref:Uncharacterized protein n=1 Tax=Halomarina rubra TaxID=2071873 RepID=A0ABD6AYT8_9EURY|nr:hypothetical protein [Halomarina rubra]
MSEQNSKSESTVNRREVLRKTAISLSVAATGTSVAAADPGSNESGDDSTGTEGPDVGTNDAIDGGSGGGGYPTLYVNLYNVDTISDGRRDSVQSALEGVAGQIGTDINVSRTTVDGSDYSGCMGWYNMYNVLDSTQYLGDGTIHYLVFDESEISDWRKGQGHGGEGMRSTTTASWTSDLMFGYNRPGIAFLNGDMNFSGARVEGTIFDNIAKSEFARTIMDKSNSPATQYGHADDINSFGTVHNGLVPGDTASPLITGKTGYNNLVTGGSDDALATCSGDGTPPRAEYTTGTLSDCALSEMRRYLSDDMY